MLVFSGVASTGCVSKELDERLAEHRESSAAQTVELASLNRSGGSIELDWKTANQLLSERNLNLRRARTRTEQIRKERDEQWKTWLPRVGVYANLQRSLGQLGSLASSDLNAAVIAPLNIPNPFTERAVAFENALSYLESVDSLELNRRRQIITLYRIFSRFERHHALAKNRPTAEEDLAVASALSALESRSVQDETLKSYQGDLVQLLNLPGSHPLPVPSTRPTLDYENRIRQLVPGRNYGQLAVRLSAYQIEGALLREKGIKLRQWPTLSVSASTPTVYDTRTESNFDAERVTLFGGLTKSYDFTGNEAALIESAAENTRFVKENLRLRLDQESREWLRLRTRYDQVLIKKKLAGERLKLVTRGTGGGSAISDLKALRDAQQALVQIDQAKEQLELEVWLWDDDKWN